MLVDYWAGVDRHDEQRIHALLSLFNYPDDVMAARDRPNRFFGHYGEGSARPDPDPGQEDPTSRAVCGVAT